MSPPPRTVLPIVLCWRSPGCIWTFLVGRVLVTRRTTVEIGLSRTGACVTTGGRDYCPGIPEQLNPRA